MRRHPTMILISLMISLCLLLLGWAALAEKESVSYRRYNAKSGTWSNETISSYMLIGNSSSSWYDVSDGWYVVKGDVTMSSKTTLRVSGQVHLILCDEAKLTVGDGVYIKSNAALHIYGQSEGTGKLVAKPKSGPGIGGMNNTRAGNLYIHGGVIDAKGGTNAAGIGGGNHNSGYGDIVIYGGNVTAQGGSSGAGIGKGQQNSPGKCGSIQIYGGKVNATGGKYAAGIGGGEDRDGGNIAIHGGTVTANAGDDGAGIGGGEGGSGGNILITGGKVEATSSSRGAGIGGGEHCSGGNITISGGEVYAYTNNREHETLGTSIGGGFGGEAGTIVINGGYVEARYLHKSNKTSGAGIGAGDEAYGGSITIGGNCSVRASGRQGAGIGGSSKKDFKGTVTITGGDVNAWSAFGAGIGAGWGGNFKGHVTISGGSVRAESRQFSAGIGAGAESELGHGGEDAGTVEFTGGTVVAISGGGGADAIGKGNGGDERGTLNLCLKAVVFGGEDEYSATASEWKDRVSAARRHFARIEIGNTYIIGFDANGGEGEMDMAEPEEDGSYILPECAFTAPAGQAFVAWKFGEEVKQPGETITITGLTTLVAQWQDTGEGLAEELDGISYRRYNDYTGAWEDRAAASCQPIVDSSASWYDISDGWYVVQGNVTLSSKTTLRVSGIANLILCDGATLTAGDGVYIKDGAKLSIFGQSEGTGKLVAKPKSGPGIGGMNNTRAGSLYIHGGTIDAKGGTNAAGIGGGNHNSGYGDIVIYGGNVTAQGGSSGAGIGKGQQNSPGKCGSIRIYGGTVNATGGNYAAGIGGGEDRDGGNIAIHGGTVYATGGDYSAGIGGGEEGSGGKITINGGQVHATAGSFGAGIGGGEDHDGGTIIINGGEIIASSNESHGAGIGGGSYGNSGDITINGGFITAEGYYGAGIGSGDDGDKVNVTINYGTVTAHSRHEGAGIGSGRYGECDGTVAINGGSVKAIGRYGAGIGAGYGEDFNGTVTVSGGTIRVKSVSGAGIGAGEKEDGDGGDCKGTIDIVGIGTSLIAESEDAEAIGYGQGGKEEGMLKLFLGAQVTAGSNESSATVADWRNRLGAAGESYVRIGNGNPNIIEFDANGGEGTMDAAQPDANGIYVLPECDFIAPEGMEFAGWLIVARIWQPGAEIDVFHPITIVAQWQPLPIGITFDANGGEGEMEAAQSDEDGNYILPECGFTAPEGMEFAGWLVDGETLSAGDAIIVSKLTVLVAQWREIEAEPTEEPVAEPTEEPAEGSTEEPAAEPTEAPADEPTEEPAAEPVEQPEEEPVEEPAGETVEQPAEESVEEPIEVPGEEPAEQLAIEQPAEEQSIVEQLIVEEPVEEPIEVPGEEPAEQPAEEPVEEPAGETVEQPAEEPAEQPIVEQLIVEAPTEEQANEEQPIVEEPTEEQPTEEQPTEEQLAEQPVEEPAEKPTEEPVEQPVEAPADAQMCTITFDGGGADGEMAAVQVALGSEYAMPECAFYLEGCVFDAWQVNGAPYHAGDVVTVEGDVTAMASWLLDEGGEVEYGEEEIEYGGGEEAEAPADDGDNGLEIETEDVAEENTEEADEALSEEPSEVGSVFSGAGIAAIISAAILALAAAGIAVTRRKKH